jgi:pteridine reductase
MPVALITGSGKKRVGFHIAEALAQRGYHIAVHYRTSQKEAAETLQILSKWGGQHKAFQAQLADGKEVQRLVNEVCDAYQTIDVLINTAAVWGRHPLEKITADDVREQWEINTLGSFLLCQKIGLKMVEQPLGGCIINFGDWATVRPYKDHAAYFPSKGTIPTITRTFAVELGLRNPKVRVNCILPGPVMLPDFLSPEEKREVVQSTLVKREGTPQDVVKAVHFLIDCDFVTGVCLPVDGGRTIYAQGY